MYGDQVEIGPWLQHIMNNKLKQHDRYIIGKKLGEIEEEIPEGEEIEIYFGGSNKESRIISDELMENTSWGINFSDRFPETMKQSVLEVLAENPNVAPNVVSKLAKKIANEAPDVSPDEVASTVEPLLL